MIIDSHQHFWQYDPAKHGWISDDMQVLKRDFMPPDLKKEIDRVGVDGCVAVQADQTEAETEFLLQLAGEYDFIKGVVGWVDIQAPDLEDRLQYFSQFETFKGVRHIVQDEPDDGFMLRPDFLRGIEKLDDYNLSYDILIYSKHLPVAVKFVEQFPRQRFVLDHIAKPGIKEGKIKDWEQGIRQLSEHPQLYCKISGMITEADWANWKPEDLQPYLEVVFDAFGPDRLLFGSDWPVCTLAGRYKEVYTIIENFINSLDETDQSKIMGENARRVYKL